MLRTSRLALALAATAAAVLAPGAAPASAAWSAPDVAPVPSPPSELTAAFAADGTVGLGWFADEQFISGTHDGTRGIEYAAGLHAAYGAVQDVDAAGNLTVLYDDAQKIRAVTRSADGGFSAPVVVSDTAGNGVLHVDVSPDGNAVFAYRDHGKLMVRVRMAGEALGPAVQVAGPEEGDEHVGIADSGETIVVHRLPGGGHVAKIRPPGGAFPPAGTPLPGPPLDSIRAMQVGAAGDVEIAGDYAPDVSRVGEVHRRAGGAFTAPAPLDPPLGAANDPVVAVAPNGDGAVVWQSDGDLWVALRRGDDVDTTPVSLHHGRGPTYAVGYDAASRPVVAWEAWNATATGSAIHEARWDPGAGEFGAPALIDTDDGLLDDLYIGGDARGNLAAAWSREAGDDLVIAASRWRAPAPVARDDVPSGPALGGAPAPGPAAVPAPAPRPVTPAPAVRFALSEMAARVRGRTASATFRVTAPATVTLVVERRAGRRWVRARRTSVRAVAGVNRARLGTLRRGRYRVTARSGTAAARAAFRISG